MLFYENPKKRKNPSLYTSTILREKLRDAILPIKPLTIRIFIQGLKDSHTLATRIYEKGPQTLTDAISEVEKLQATEQLTATLIPSSTVNVMCNEEDHCFQCQEAGHIA